ncbi:MAG: hypothetical protein KAJ42_14465 [Gemmatimonadetes bacterium]|nr:hypothetical protein [Gemmatimonadota bacterium]
MIHVLRDRELVLPGRRRPDLVLPMRIEGKILSVELVDAKSGIIKRRLGPFPNVIVDAGLDAIGNGDEIDALITYLAVGTDNTAPTTSDTSLASQLGDRTNSNGSVADVVSSGPAYAYWQLARTRVFTEEEVNGNLTELGLFKLASGGTMWCRQLFLDDLGDPTTVTKTDTEQLRVVYAWRLYTPTSETENVFDIDGESTTCKSRGMRINEDEAWGSDGYLQFLGNWTTDYRRSNAYETNTFPTTTGGTFTGTPAQSSSISIVAYSNGNFYRDIDIVFEPGVANFGTGIGALELPYEGPFIDGEIGLATTFTPRVDKDDTERFTFRARLSFARS